MKLNSAAIRKPTLAVFIIGSGKQSNLSSQLEGLLMIPYTHLHSLSHLDCRQRHEPLPAHSSRMRASQIIGYDDPNAIP